MSRFLKVIVHTFIIVAILVAVAIVVPPLAGVTTTIVDTETMDTNLPMGSITYSRDIAVTDLVSGDKILKESETSTYAYVIQAGDAATGKFQAENAYQQTVEEITLRNHVSRVILTIPVIGYVLVAMHSMEGIIIIVLVLLLMVVLFILSELWKKDDSDDDDSDDDDEEDDDEEDEDEDGNEEAEDDEDDEEDEPLSRRERKARRKEEKRRKKEEKKRAKKEKRRRDNEDDDDLKDIRFVTEEAPAAVSAEDRLSVVPEKVPGEAADSVTAEEAAVPQMAPASEAPVLSEPVPVPTVQTETGKTENERGTGTGSTIIEETPSQTDDGRFVPVSRMTLDELMEEAGKNGVTPKVIKDPNTNVTLLDYTDLL